MVVAEDAQCEGSKWFELNRCQGFKSCDESSDGTPCDFKDLPYTKEAINEKLNLERLELVKLMRDKKDAKKAGDKKKIKCVDRQMVDKYRCLSIRSNIRKEKLF